MLLKLSTGPSISMAGSIQCWQYQAGGIHSPADCVQHILVDPLIACSQACLHAHRGLIGDLDAHLQKPNRELRVRLGRYPQPAGQTQQ